MLSFTFGILLFFLGTIGPFIYGPALGLAVFSAFTHITPIQLHIVFLRPALVVAIASLVSYLFSRNYPTKFNIIPLELVLLWVMLLGMFLGAYNAYDSELAFQHFYIYCKYFLFFWMFVNIITNREHLRLFQNFLILGAAWLVYKCWDLRGTMGGRFENLDGGVVGDSNHFAAALVILFPIVLMRALKEDRIYLKIGALLGCFGIIMSIIISTSRGGFLGLTALFISLLFVFKKFRKPIAVSLFLLSLISMPFVTQYYENRISTIFESEGQRDSSIQLRLDSWSTAIDVWKKYPIYGCGLRNFIYYNGYENEGKYWGEKGHVAHSIWFEALGEGGVLVFIPLVLMLGLFFVRTQKAKRKFSSEPEIVLDINALQVGMIGFLVCATFLNRLIYEPIYWWCAMSFIYHKRLETSSPAIPKNKSAS